MNRTTTQEVTTMLRRLAVLALAAFWILAMQTPVGEVANSAVTAPFEAVTHTVDDAIAAPVGRPHVIQTKWLTASKDWQTWTSSDQGDVVYLEVTDGESKIPQHYENPCRASYSTHLLKVSVTLPQCHKPGPHPFVIRYRSTFDGNRFRVRLTEGG